MRTDLNEHKLNRNPVHLLRDVYRARKERNPLYSISAFARDLGISISLLSRVLSGNRPLSIKLAMQITAALDMNEADSKAFLYSVLQASSKTAKISKKLRATLEKNLTSSEDHAPAFTTVEVEQFKAMASWYHLAILNLTTIEGFQNDANWIARKLGITSNEACDAVERLITIGLLQESGETLSRTRKNFYVKTARSEYAIRKFHEQMIAKASEELKDSTDEAFQRRLINGITFACSEENLEIIKEKIDRFEDEILRTVADGQKDSVYQLNVQFFPLSKSKKPQKEK